MYQIEEQVLSLQKVILEPIISSKFVKKAMQFLVSVYLFSFLLSQYPFSWYPSFNISTLLNHANDKNCIFLVFNGLLVFLAKTSGLLHFSSTSDLKDFHKYDTGSHHAPITFQVKESVLCNTSVSVSDQPLGYVDIEVDEGKEARDCMSVSRIEDEEDEEEEEELDDEELDKLFDKFIRRMKEEMRVGADQPHELVMSSL